MGCIKLHIIEEEFLQECGSSIPLKHNIVIKENGLKHCISDDIGCAECYRFSFNGMEKDEELKGLGNSLDFGARIYDPRIGRWLSIDPLAAKYPMLSTYLFVANNPIYFIDPNGEDIVPSSQFKNSNYYTVLVKIVNQHKSNSFTKKYLKKYDNPEKNLYFGYHYFWNNPKAIEGTLSGNASAYSDGNLIFFNSMKVISQIEELSTNIRRGKEINELGMVARIFHEVIHSEINLGPEGTSVREHNMMGNMEGQYFKDAKQGILDYAKKNKITVSDEEATALVWLTLEKTTTLNIQRFNEYYSELSKKAIYEDVKERLYYQPGISEQEWDMYEQHEKSLNYEGENIEGEPIKFNK
jgi:RHS repeat-associated protein